MKRPMMIDATAKRKAAVLSRLLAPYLARAWLDKLSK